MAIQTYDKTIRLNVQDDHNIFGFNNFAVIYAEQQIVLNQLESK